VRDYLFIGKGRWSEQRVLPGLPVGVFSVGSAAALGLLYVWRTCRDLRQLHLLRVNLISSHVKSKLFTVSCPAGTAGRAWVFILWCSRIVR